MWLPGYDKCGQEGDRPPGTGGALHAVEALAFHGDIMKKSIEKAGFPGLGGARGRELHESTQETDWYFQPRRSLEQINSSESHMLLASVN